MIPFPDKKYSVIYADPPWSYKVWTEAKKCAQGTAKAHYNTMDIDAICALPVSDLAAPDCKLFLWATPPCMPEALRCLASWGFVYKTFAFTWVKTNPVNGKPFYGIGHWTASNAEICLAGLRPGGKLNRVAKNISQIDMSPRGAHSVKPPGIRDKIVRLCGDVPRIELFARTAAPGWDVWGNEINELIEEPL